MQRIRSAIEDETFPALYASIKKRWAALDLHDLA